MNAVRHILCDGDSMLLIPGTRQRHAYEKRWTGMSSCPGNWMASISMSCSTGNWPSTFIVRYGR